MNESSTEKVVLRKKSPFFCRTMIAGKTTCLKPLAETDGDFCAPCALKQKEVSERPIHREIEPVRDSRFMTDAEWEACRARGPMWPTDDVPENPEPIYHPAVQPQEVA